MLAFNWGHHRILHSRKYHLNKCHWKSPNFGAWTRFSFQGFRHRPVHEKSNTKKITMALVQMHHLNWVYTPIQTCEEQECQYRKEPQNWSGACGWRYKDIPPKGLGWLPLPLWQLYRHSDTRHQEVFNCDHWGSPIVITQETRNGSNQKQLTTISKKRNIYTTKFGRWHARVHQIYAISWWKTDDKNEPA